MLDDFIFRALLTGLGTALSAGVLGCFVSWKRMSYFGDAMSHAAILGVALSLLSTLPLTLGIALTTVIMSVILHRLQSLGHTADSSLGLISHSALALGLLIASLSPNTSVPIESYLFGSILTVQKSDVIITWLGTTLILGTMWFRWSKLLLSTLSTELAFASGINPKREDLIFTLLLAVFIALGIKIIGALLMTALLIIPSAAAKNIAKTPETMALYAISIGGISAFGGLHIAVLWDTPVGPSIVCTALLCFIITLAFKRPT